MIYKLQSGGVVKLQGAGIVPKIRTLFSRFSKSVPKTIESLPTINKSQDIVPTIKVSYIAPKIKEIPIPGVLSKPSATDPSYLEDIFAIKDAIGKYGYVPDYAEPAIKFMEDAYNSPWYKKRYTNIYGSELGLDKQFWKEHFLEKIPKLRDPRNVYVSVNSVRKFHGIAPDGRIAFDVPVSDGDPAGAVLDLTNHPQIGRRFIFTKKGSNSDELQNFLEHELDHVAFDSNNYPEIGYENVKVVPELEKNAPEFANYLLQPHELHARGIPTAHHMYLQGYDPNSEIDWLRYYIDETPKLPNQRDIYHFSPKTLKPFTKMLSVAPIIGIGTAVINKN